MNHLPPLSVRPSLPTTTTPGRRLAAAAGLVALSVLAAGGSGGCQTRVVDADGIGADRVHPVVSEPAAKHQTFGSFFLEED